MDLQSRPAEPSADPTGWFEALYRAADAGTAEVPWDRGTPNPLLVEWVVRTRPPVAARTVVVGAGYGRDAEYLAGLGFPTTAFDVSPSAVAATRARFPDSRVTYAVGDLLALPPAWSGAFDLVVESMTVQALPEPPRSAAIAGVRSLVAPGGILVVFAFGTRGSAADRAVVDGPPWPLLRAEVESFGGDGIELVELEGIQGLEGPDDPSVLRWRAEWRRT
jgi:SAM-dependent methyltransferase